MKKVGRPFFFTLITFGGSILPLVFSAVYLKVFGINHEWPNFSRLTGNGEISIICIPLAITIIYSLYTTKDRLSFSRWSDLVFWLTSLFILFGVFFYAGQMENTQESPNYYYMQFSIIFGIWTIIATFSSKIIEERRTNPIRERQDEMDKLNSKFENSHN